MLDSKKGTGMHTYTASTAIPIAGVSSSTGIPVPKKVRVYPIDVRVLNYIKKQGRGSVPDICDALGCSWLKAARACSRLSDSGKIAQA